MRTIGVVTVARSDYGISLPILRGIKSSNALRLHLIVSGMHLSPEFGRTITEIENDGFNIADRVEMLLSSDSPEGIAKSIGLGTIGFSQLYTRIDLDVLLVLGDRFEMYAAALAALPFKLPVAHVHGGEITYGAIDDALRHSITKLSHLHFVATAEYAQRVEQLGEEKWRIMVSGAPSLDNQHSMNLMTHDELSNRYGFSLDLPLLLVTFHPVTLEYEQTKWHMAELLAALDDAKMSVVFTMPNADTNGRIIRHIIEDYVQNNATACAVDNLGVRPYFSFMNVAAAMVGNSSSGIIESPSFKLPVINVGTRQHGRVKSANIIDVDYNRHDILAGIRKAVDSGFISSLDELVNPYSNGGASDIIVDRLQSVSIDEKLVMKRFVDMNRVT